MPCICLTKLSERHVEIVPCTAVVNIDKKADDSFDF